MKFSDLSPRIVDMKYTHMKSIEELYKCVLENKFTRVLELGTAFGKGTVAIAAALEELGGGTVDTVDLKNVEARIYQGSCKNMLESLGLGDYVNIHLENHTYNWFLKKMLEQQKKGNGFEPVYDFVFVDGAHNFTVDGLAFFLCDRLVKLGGTILFDDLKYNYHHMNESQGRSNEIEVDTFDPRSRVAKAPMGEDELKECHVKLIYELLVKTHPQYGDFRYSDDGNWGYAVKVL